MKIALFILGVLLIAVTVLPVVRSEEWWIRVFDFPRLQIAILLAAVLVAFVFFYQPARALDTVFVIALLGSLGYQGYRIFPYTPLPAVQVIRANPCDATSSIRLLIANVLMDNRRADDFLALVRANDPDLVLAVETDHWWDQQLSALDQGYPFSIKRPIDNTYGMHLFSRLELENPEVRFLIEDDVPSVRTRVQLKSGDWIDFYGLHPRPPKPKQDTEARDAEILIVGKEVKAAGKPAIIAGDLNDVAWSHTTRLFQRISGTLDPRIGRGMFSTFHAKYPVFRWPLDHVFHEESFTIRELKRLGYFGSDHFPVLAELCYEPKAAPRQEAPTADQEDREEAEDKIEEGKEAGDSAP
jgi:endonuclease/exonuclease/phosphatase (EEP) superfamily protein YafD